MPDFRGFCSLFPFDAICGKPLLRLTAVLKSKRQDLTPFFPIMVNNQRCLAGIEVPTINNVGAEPVCGVLKYKPATKTTDKIVMKYSVGHPANYANYSFGLVKGVNSVALPPPTSGPVTLALMSLNVTATVDSLLGPCTVAGYAESVYVATTIQNGWGRQSQYDASALIAFVLTP